MNQTFVEEHSNTDRTPYLFNGKELDSLSREAKRIGKETGLYYYGARYYEPQTSVWLSVDPAALKMPAWSPYNYTFNNPVKYNDPDGRLPIIPLLIKAGAGGAADMLAQATMNYYFNPATTGDVGASFEAVNWLQVGRSAAEGLIPWKTPGGKLGRASATALGDVMINAISSDGEYSKEQALQDFAVGFIGDLAGGGIGELLSKYGAKAVTKGLMGMGFDTKYIRQATGGLSNKDVRSWYSDQVKNIDINLKPTEVNARSVVNQRNTLKQQARELMSDRKAAADLDRSDPIRGFDYYREKYGGDYSRIMKGGTTPNANMNKKLGID